MLSASVLALIISVGALILSFTKTDLVYVDVNQLVEGYDRTKTEREAFKEKATALKANVDSLIMDWQKELKAYEKERASLTKKELDVKQQLLQNRQQQINNYQQAIQKQIQEEDQKMTQTVINDINGFVKEYGKKHGHRIIFGAQGSGNIMYAEEVTNLTHKILEGLNAEYNGE